MENKSDTKVAPPPPEKSKKRVSGIFYDLRWLRFNCGVFDMVLTNFVENVRRRANEFSLERRIEKGYVDYFPHNFPNVRQVMYKEKIEVLSENKKEGQSVKSLLKDACSFAFESHYENEEEPTVFVVTTDEFLLRMLHNICMKGVDVFIFYPYRENLPSLNVLRYAQHPKFSYGNLLDIVGVDRNSFTICHRYERNPNIFSTVNNPIQAQNKFSKPHRARHPSKKRNQASMNVGQHQKKSGSKRSVYTKRHKKVKNPQESVEKKQKSKKERKKKIKDSNQMRKENKSKEKQTSNRKGSNGKQKRVIKRKGNVHNSSGGKSESKPILGKRKRGDKVNVNDENEVEDLIVIGSSSSEEEVEKKEKEKEKESVEDEEEKQVKKKRKVHHNPKKTSTQSDVNQEKKKKKKKKKKPSPPVTQNDPIEILSSGEEIERQKGQKN